MDDATMMIIGVVVLGGLSLIAACAVGYVLYANNQKRIQKLEDLNDKRLNHRTAANIEDITASLIYAVQAREVEDLHIQQALRFARMARVDPQNYDPDEPNGRKG